jgi:hypothetical protein
LKQCTWEHQHRADALSQADAVEAAHLDELESEAGLWHRAHLDAAFGADEQHF